MSIKLIAVDIDGTLVNSQKEITPEVFSAIQDAKEAGVKVVIATGRPIAGVAKLLDDLQLRDEGDYVVTFNGALVQETATGHEIISESLTYEDYLDHGIPQSQARCPHACHYQGWNLHCQSQYRKIYCARINPRQHAHLLPYT